MVNSLALDWPRGLDTKFHSGWPVDLDTYEQKSSLTSKKGFELIQRVQKIGFRNPHRFKLFIE